MKPLVTLALVCALFSEAYPLDCNVCNTIGTTSCSETTVTCPAQHTKCASLTATLQNGQNQTELRLKTCATPALCISGSYTIGNLGAAFNTECCDSDLCNSQFPASPVSNPNGNKCFTCMNNTCTDTLECKGSEDHCITITVSVSGLSQTQKGCASQSVCSGNTFSEVGNFGVNVKCCQGDLCNSALRIGQSILFLLLVPLASFILFI